MSDWVKDKIFIPFLGVMIAFYMKFVFYTGKWKLKEHQSAKPILEDSSKGAVFIVWHGRLLMPLVAKKPSIKMFAIVSKNKVGEIAHHCTKFFNVSLIRGSAFNPRKPQKSKGGGEALKITIELLKKGEKVIITPDGPKGPYQTLKVGAILAAKKANVPIIPVSFHSKKAITLKSWDKFLFPLPFTGGVIAYGEPFYLNDSLEEEIIELDRGFIEKKLQEFTRNLENS